MWIIVRYLSNHIGKHSTVSVGNGEEYEGEHAKQSERATEQLYQGN